MTTPGYHEFEIDVGKILKAELPGLIRNIADADLTLENVAQLPPKAKGAYVLLQSGHLVYAGKTDASHGFRDRLRKHAQNVQHRRNLDPRTISFKAVRIMVFSNFDVEAILIKELRKGDSTLLPWNFSGFGSNDPGHRREHQEPAKFDLECPLDLDRPLEFVSAGTYCVRDLLVILKRKLPYYFRYETDVSGKKANSQPTYASMTVGHAEQRAAVVVIGNEHPTLAGILKAVVDVLPKSAWQATVFPGRVILYRENISYHHALKTIRANA